MSTHAKWATAATAAMVATLACIFIGFDAGTAVSAVIALACDAIGFYFKERNRT